MEQDVNTIAGTAERAKAEGLNIGYGTLRRWVMDGTLHAVYAGKKALIYYPNLVALIRGDAKE